MALWTRIYRYAALGFRYEEFLAHRTSMLTQSLAHLLDKLFIALPSPLIFTRLLNVMQLVTQPVLVIFRHSAPSGHLLDQLAAASFLDSRLELRSEIDAHLLGPLLRPHPNVARVAIVRIVARLRRVETRKSRRLALDHRERRHDSAQARRFALRASETLAPPRRTHHHVRAD